MPLQAEGTACQNCLKIRLKTGPQPWTMLDPCSVAFPRTVTPMTHLIRNTFRYATWRRCRPAGGDGKRPGR